MVIVTLPPDWPSSSPSVSVPLPEPLQLHWGPHSSLSDIVRQCEQVGRLYTVGLA